MNNVAVETMADGAYGCHFGFTKEEVEEHYVPGGPNADDLKLWYNSYNIGAVSVYNPWSIVQATRNKTLDCWWLDSGNASSFFGIIALTVPHFLNPYCC